jgi:hypothetical protein
MGWLQWLHIDVSFGVKLLKGVAACVFYNIQKCLGFSNIFSRITNNIKESKSK